MAKEYQVHFSFYSEQYGYFDDFAIKVEAENQFEARRLAWEMSEENENFKFCSCLKLCGITWQTSPLDLQDYFNAQAAYDNYQIHRIENVNQSNARINKSEEEQRKAENERHEHYGSLWTIRGIASDMGRAHGLLPPHIYDELHYAREFLDLLNNDFDQYNAFLKKIEQAEKWDSGAMFDIRDLCKHGYLSTAGFDFDFSEHLKKVGICPVYADPQDREYKYTNRWNNAMKYRDMAYLPFFGEKDTIRDSQTMPYAWQTLVLDKEALLPQHQSPLNSLWIANQESEGDFDRHGDRAIIAENLFTGAIVEWKRTDFLGVLRPEKSANIDFDTIKEQYKAWEAGQNNESGTEQGDSDVETAWQAEQSDEEAEM